VQWVGSLRMYVTPRAASHLNGNLMREMLVGAERSSSITIAFGAHRD
jgi:hypothetical protein